MCSVCNGVVYSLRQVFPVENFCCVKFATRNIFTMKIFTYTVFETDLLVSAGSLPILIPLAVIEGLFLHG